MANTYYTCVVYSGSTCMCGVLRHTHQNCGHKHISKDAAFKCLAKLRDTSKDGNSCSAAWCHGEVAEREREHDTAMFWHTVVDKSGKVYLDDERISAYDACKCN